jgi:phosphonoacetate hydrolase
MLSRGISKASSKHINKESDVFLYSRGISVQAANEGVDQGIDFVKLVGRAPPSIYDHDVSVYTLEVGYRLLQQDLQRSKTGIYYLSTTDYVTHKYAPDTNEAKQFFSSLDRIIGQIDATGAVVGVTSDHGMNDKSGYAGNPRVVYLQSILDEMKVPGLVVLPITDPHLLHHAGLGGFATIYLDDKSHITKVMQRLRTESGVYTVLGKDDACRGLDLPGDLIGDMVVLGDQNTVVGKTPQHHDLSALNKCRLRSHGGLDESTVPMLVNKPLDLEVQRLLTRGKLRNFDLFEVLLNTIKA